MTQNFLRSSLVVRRVMIHIPLSRRCGTLAQTARKEVTDVSWFSKGVGNPLREALLLRIVQQ